MMNVLTSEAAHAPWRRPVPFHTPGTLPARCLDLVSGAAHKYQMTIMLQPCHDQFTAAMWRVACSAFNIITASVVALM